MVVYLITNLINGKKYVGKTVHTLSDRWSQHKYAARRDRKHSHLHSAMRRYGIGAFRAEVICTCSAEKELFRQERYFIKRYGTKNRRHGYNLTDGGEIGPVGMVHSKESRRKMSKSHSGKNHHFFGKHHSEETRDKIARSNTGKTATQAARNKMSRTRRGVSKTAAHRRKLAINLKKARAAQKAANAYSHISGKNHHWFGKRHIATTRAKMSIAVRTRWSKVKPEDRIPWNRNDSGRKKAIKLRNRGLSLAQIVKKLKLAKSTVWAWVGRQKL